MKVKDCMCEEVCCVKPETKINEVAKLMEQLLVLPNPFTCPHGRPTAIKMTKNDIERKFSRR